MTSHLPPAFIESILAADVIVVFCVWFIFHRAIRRAGFTKQKQLILSILTVAILSGWFIGATLLAQSGFFQTLSLGIPNVGLLFIPIILGLSLLQNSANFRKIVDALEMHWLIAVQFFRVMGWVFLDLHARGLMPAEFAFPSGYGDLLVGTTALIVAYVYFLKKPYARKLATVWNYVGIVDLALAIFLGFFTSPTSYQQLAFDLPNGLLFAYPLALVPTFAVPLSILLHLFTLRRLRAAAVAKSKK